MRRLHPLTVPLRAVNGLGSLFAIVVFTTFVGSGGPFQNIGPVLVSLGLLAIVVVVGYQYAYYRRFTYAVTDDTLDIASGVISRQRREIPLGRVQNVDISQGLIQRALGIAAVDFETAGGGSTEAQLRYVSRGEARRLQDVIRGHTPGDERKQGDAAEAEGRDASSPGPSGELLFSLDQRSLVVVSALSFDVRVFSLVQTAGALASPALLGVFLDAPRISQIPLVVVGVAVLLTSGWLLGAAVTFTRYYGFRLTRFEEELRYERGLVQRFSGTIPLEKIQSMTIRENVLMRNFGYAALSIETAGYGGGDEPSGGSEAAVPLDTRPAVISLAQSLEPFEDVAFESPPERTKRRYVRRYRLVTLGITAGLTALVWWLEVPDVWFSLPLATLIGGILLAGPAAQRGYQSRGYVLTSGYAVTRNGWWRRGTAVVPLYRLQNVIDRRSIFQRRWSLATVEFDTAGSLSLMGATGQAVDIDTERARSLSNEAADGLQEALRTRRRDEARNGQGITGD